MRTTLVLCATALVSGILALGAPLAAQAAPVKAAAGTSAPLKAVENPAAVKRAFEAQFDTAGQFPPAKVAIVSGYALQTWRNDHAHGAAVMQYDRRQGWLFIESGDGDWDAPSLTQMGVPADVAQKLIADLAE